MGARGVIAAAVLLCVGGCDRALSSRTPPATEICNIAIAGSNTIGDALAPRLVAAFLEYNGFPAPAPVATGEHTVRLVGVKGAQTCTVDIRSKGSSIAFEELAKGTAQIGMSSRAIKDQEAAALRDAGAGDFVAETSVAEHVIALDGIAVIANPALGLTSIRKADITRIFLGEVRDWKAFGAPAGEINRYARNDASGTFQFFFERALDKDARWSAQAPNVKRFEGSHELVAAVANDPAGIGFVAAAFATPSVTVLKVSDGGPAFAPDALDIRSEAYPISRRLFVYTRPADYRNNKFVHALVDYMKSSAAFDTVEAAHFLSLRTAPTAGATIAATCAGETAEAAAYRSVTQGAARLPAVIRFDASATGLDSLARDDVRRLAAELKSETRGAAAVVLVGHSDSAGDPARNRRLALERARALQEALTGLNVEGARIESAGEACPIASNDTEEGRRSNRRVEIWVARPA